MIPAPQTLLPLTLTDFGAVRGSVALSDPLTLTLTPGTVLGIVGPNGVGKSSLLGAIAHSGVASYGSAAFGDEEISKAPARRRAQLVSLMAQDHGAPGELRVRELVGVGAWASGREDPAEAVDSALARAGVAHLADRRYSVLSGGQRQLVQLARVLAQNTPLVVLDEPTSALDLSHQRAVEQIMRGLGNQGRIVIAAIHDLSLALNACTRVLLLEPGGTSHNGTPHEVLGPDRVFAAYGVRTTIHTTPQGRRILAADD
ncbi:ABC transporter ATP-binding protein [Leucobacter sp. BZR 635]